MIKTLVFAFTVSVVVSVLLALVVIPLLKKFRIGQPILSYVKEHSKKSGTATMGGVIFIVTVIIVFLLFSKNFIISKVCVLVFVSYGVIGFCDDFIKIKFNRNDGLTPWQKILFQTLVAVIASAFSVRFNLTGIYIPFTDKLINLGPWFFPLSVFLYLACTNCLNLTDGLDGLASSVSAVIFIAIAVLIVCEIKKFGGYYVDEKEFYDVALVCVCVSGALIGFLAFNTSVASVFMGDTGSLALGGLISSVMLFSGNALFIPLFCITLVISGASVIVQVLHYKRTKRRVFLMAPLHHHFQHKGYAESKIVFWYKMLTLLVCASCLIYYLE